MKNNLSLFKAGAKVRLTKMSPTGGRFESGYWIEGVMDTDLVIGHKVHITPIKDSNDNYGWDWFHTSRVQEAHPLHGNRMGLLTENSHWNIEVIP
jgi:hypothetical protein